MRRNAVFALEVARKLLLKLEILAKFRKESRDVNRGSAIFGAVSSDDQRISAEFLKFLLKSLRTWGQIYRSESDPTLSTFYRTYTSLVTEGVSFPEDIEGSLPLFDLDEFQTQLNRLELTLRSGVYGSVYDNLAVELKAKYRELEAVIITMRGKSSETTIKRYLDVQRKAGSIFEQYDQMKYSSQLYSSSFPVKSAVPEWDAEPFPEDSQAAAKPSEEMEFGFDDVEAEIEQKAPPKKPGDFDFDAKWETGDFFNKEFATAPVHFSPPIIPENRDKEKSKPLPLPPNFEQEKQELNDIINQQVAKIAEQTASIAVLQAEVQKLNRIIKEKDGIVKEKEAENEKLKTEIEKNREEMENYERKVENLRQELNQITDNSEKNQAKYELEKQEFQIQIDTVILNLVASDNFSAFQRNFLLKIRRKPDRSLFPNSKFRLTRRKSIRREVICG